MTIDTSKGIAGLKGALRYVRAYRDQVFVVKLGGEVLGEPEVLEQRRPASSRCSPRSASGSWWCTAAVPRPRP